MWEHYTSNIPHGGLGPFANELWYNWLLANDELGLPAPLPSISGVNIEGR